MAELLECNQLKVDTEDVVEKEDDDLMALVAKTFSRFRARNKWFSKGNPSGPSNSKSYDKSPITCFKCGKNGHFMKNCPSKSFSYTPPANESLKSKYKNIRAHLALQDSKTSKMVLLAESKEKDWMYSNSWEDKHE